MKRPNFDLFLVFALATGCAVIYGLLIAKVTTWTIWQPLEVFFTG